MDITPKEVIFLTKYDQKKLILEADNQAIVELMPKLKQVIMENPGVTVSPELFKLLGLEWGNSKHNMIFDMCVDFTTEIRVLEIVQE